MVTTGPYSLSMRPNYFGDWLRWMSNINQQCLGTDAGYCAAEIQPEVAPHPLGTDRGALSLLFRYTSFAMVTGRPLAFLLPALVILMNLGAVKGNVKDNRERYGDVFVTYASKVRK